MVSRASVVQSVTPAPVVTAPPAPVVQKPKRAVVKKQRPARKAAGREAARTGRLAVVGRDAVTHGAPGCVAGAARSIAVPEADVLQRGRFALAGVVLALVAVGGGVLLGVGGKSLKDATT